jgi:hypothetical protein
MSVRGATATVNPAAALEQTKRRLFIPDQTTTRPSVAIRTLAAGLERIERYRVAASPAGVCANIAAMSARTFSGPRNFFPA